LSYGCPVCNGLQALVISCPQCSQALLDGGRAEDYLGPYSPYQPAEGWQMTHEVPYSGSPTCVHYLYCENCVLTVSYTIDEQLL
jgi:hypothetical protein